MIVRIVSAALLALALPAASAAQTPRWMSLMGSWTCTTVRGSTVKHVFTAGAGDAFSMQNTFTTPGGATGALVENYTYDKGAATWNLRISQTPLFGPYHGTAKAWSDAKWTFEGSEPFTGDDGVKRDTAMRVVYTDLFPAGFRREFQFQSDGAWRDVSEEVCIR
jgi:hypothetical protein